MKKDEEKEPAGRIFWSSGTRNGKEIIGGGSDLQGSSERRGWWRRRRGTRTEQRGKTVEGGEGGEDWRGRRVSEVAARTPGHRGRLFSALPGDECDRHANSGQHPCPPSNPGTQPSHGPQGHQAGARTGGVGLCVCPDTTRTPLPCLSLGCCPLSHSGTLGVGWGSGARVPGQRREDDRKEQILRESSPEEETHPLKP